MDSFSRTKLWLPLSYLLPFSERSIALVKRWLVHQKELKLIRTCPTLTKVLLKVAHAFLYIDGSLQSHQTVPCRCYYLLPFSERSIALVKRLAGSPELKLIRTCPTLTKVPKVAHAFLYTLMDFFQSHQTVASRCYLTFFHFP
jgi:hypothetical protein